MAGFGLIFVGIGILQAGMIDLQDVVTPDFSPGDDFSGRLLLVLTGLLITLVTQSSSAGVAAVLAATSVGAISFFQVAALRSGPWHYRSIPKFQV